MIRIFFIHDEIYNLEVQGHANYSNFGNDIVCASVSAITQALAMKLEKMDVEQSIVCNGNLAIICKPGEKDLPIVSSLYDMALTYLKAIEEHYPKNVKVYM